MGHGTSQQLRVRQAANTEAKQQNATRCASHGMHSGHVDWCVGCVATPHVLSC
jgi:hypothetical protein